MADSVTEEQPSELRRSLMKDVESNEDLKSSSRMLLFFNRNLFSVEMVDIKQDENTNLDSIEPLVPVSNKYGGSLLMQSQRSF